MPARRKARAGLRSRFPQSRKTTVRSLEVGGRLGDQAGERKEAVLLGQRQLGRVDEHQTVLADRAEDALHGHQRTDGVTVGVLVGDDDQLARVAQFGQDQLAIGALAVSAHWLSAREPGPISESSSSEIRMPRSIDPSYSKVKVGVCLSLSSVATRPWR